MNYTIQVTLTPSKLPNFPLADATVLVTDGPLQGLRMTGYRVYRICGELRAVYEPIPDYVLTVELHHAILDTYQQVANA